MCRHQNQVKSRPHPSDHVLARVNKNHRLINLFMHFHFNIIATSSCAPAIAYPCFAANACKRLAEMAPDERSRHVRLKTVYVALWVYPMASFGVVVLTVPRRRTKDRTLTPRNSLLRWSTRPITKCNSRRRLMRARRRASPRPKTTRIICRRYFSTHRYRYLAQMKASNKITVSRDLATNARKSSWVRL